MTTPDRPTPAPIGWLVRRLRNVPRAGANVVLALPRLGAFTVGFLVPALGGRVAEKWRARARTTTLPSLYDRYPEAVAASRRTRGVQSVPLDQVVGTLRHPSQNTADFLPLPQLRGNNWRARWQRINRALNDLAILPPVELVKVGDEYFVSDGHNRVAAARLNGGVEVDADVTELVLPGVETAPAPPAVGSSLAAGIQLREAGSGRLSRTASISDAVDPISRRDILRATGPNARPPGEDTDPAFRIPDVREPPTDGTDEPDAAHGEAKGGTRSSP